MSGDASVRRAIEVDGGSVVFCAVYCRSGFCRGGWPVCAFRRAFVRSVASLRLVFAVRSVRFRRFALRAVAKSADSPNRGFAERRICGWRRTKERAKRGAATERTKALRKARRCAAVVSDRVAGGLRRVGRGGLPVTRVSCEVGPRCFRRVFSTVNDGGAACE